MKVVLQTLTACLLAAAPASSQILTETFDFSTTAAFPPTGWAVAGLVPPFWQEASLAGPGMTVLTADAAVHAPFASSLASSTLTAPAMDFSAVIEPRLVFDSEVQGVSQMAHNGSGDGRCIVDVSTDGGVLWVPILDYQPATGGLISDVTVSLAALAGEASVTLRFRYRGTNAHAWGIDNVVVEDAYTGGPLLQLSAAPVGGQFVDVQASNMTPNTDCIFVFSINGSGPLVVVGVGTLMVSMPVIVSPTLPANASGEFSFTTLIPLTLSGGTLNGHVLEVQPGPSYVLSNHYSANVQ